MSAAAQALCQTCGACCAYSADWPRFGLETEEEILAIPPEYMDDARGTMRCDGNRCSALEGEVGVAAACSVYAVRPQVCRSCELGDEACNMARRRYGFAPVTPMTAAR
jgi:Fe-S-cluster containining protein